MTKEMLLQTIDHMIKATDVAENQQDYALMAPQEDIKHPQHQIGWLAGYITGKGMGNGFLQAVRRFIDEG